MSEFLTRPFRESLFSKTSDLIFYHICTVIIFRTHLQTSMAQITSNEDPLTTEYIEGERVLAYHGALLYEAKVLKVDQKEDPVTHARKPVFFLHYQGWNDRWDEWVETNRILKYSDDNKKVQEDLRNEHKKISTKRSTMKLNNSDCIAKGPGEVKSKKRKLAQEKVILCAWRTNRSAGCGSQIQNRNTSSSEE